MASRPSSVISSVPPQGPDLIVGSQVTVSAGQGIIRWTGTNPTFAKGRWVGVELFGPDGKNDGSVAGESYFSCREKYGVFVRPSQVTVIKLPLSRPSSSASSSTTGSRPSSRPSIAGSVSTPNTKYAIGRQSSHLPSTSNSGPISRAGSPQKLASRPSIPPTPTNTTTATGASTLSSRPSSSSALGRVPSSNTTTTTTAATTTTAQQSRQSISPLPPPITPIGKSSLRPSDPTILSSSTKTTLGSTRKIGSTSVPYPSIRPNENQHRQPTRSVVSADEEEEAEPEQEAEEQGHGDSAENSADRRGQMNDKRTPRVGGISQPTEDIEKDELPLPPPTRGLSALPPYLPQSSNDPSSSSSSSTQPLRFSRLSPPKPKVPLPMESALASEDAESSRVHRTTLIRDQGMEELRIKLRVVETKRGEEIEKLRAAEMKGREVDELRRAVGVMQSKIQTLQTELTHFRLTTTALQSHNASLEARLQDTNDQLEMATLDKEMAEERGESLELELEHEKERVVDLEVAVETLKARNDEYEQPPSDVGSGEERSSIAFIQLEKHNDRLKDALLRLRDLSGETDRENRMKIAELEKDLSETAGLQTQYELVKNSLENAELQVEDLKIQLDDALGAEEMLELLTGKNLAMGEKLEEMRITIEDLEALKELNDELEENHVETEKQLQEEIDIRESLYKQQVRKSEDLEDLVVDHQGTISQFRELVMELQAELEHLRERQVSQQSSTENMTSHSQSVLNQNLKLQSTVAKAQSKAIDLDLLKFQNAQASEHISILQAYLPKPYFELDADATNCVLFFDRLAQKTLLMNSIIGQNQNLPEDLYVASSDTLVITCEMRGKLSHFSLLNRRFAAILKRCSPELYVKICGVYHELSGIEKRMDGYIELLRKDEFKDTDCMGDLIKHIAQYEHLEEAYFNQSDLDLGERELDMVLGFDYDLDNFLAAVGFAKHAIVTAAQDSEIHIETGATSLNEVIYAPIDHLFELVKSVKLASKKLVKRVEDLVQSSSALQPTLLPHLNSLVTRVSNAVDFAIQLAQQIKGHVEEIKSSKSTLQLSTFVSLLRDMTLNVTGEVGQPWDVIAGLIANLGQEAAAILPTLMEQENAIKISSSAPWLVRAEKMAAQAMINTDSEQKCVRLNEEVQELSREIKKRERLSQETDVKVQVLERKVETAKQQAETIEGLEIDLGKVKKHERALEDAIELMQAELDKAEADVTKLKQTQVQAVHGEESTMKGTGVGQGEMTTVEGNLETHYLIDQIESLRTTVRYIRQENSFLKSQTLLKTLRTLPSLPSLPSLHPRSHLQTLDNPTIEPIVEGITSTSASADTPTNKFTPDDSVLTTESIRSLRAESKTLLKAITSLSTNSLVVDLTATRAQGRCRIGVSTPTAPTAATSAVEAEIETTNEGSAGKKDRDTEPRAHAVSTVPSATTDELTASSSPGVSPRPGLNPPVFLMGKGVRSERERESKRRETDRLADRLIGLRDKVRSMRVVDVM
ncbi:Microtubule-associated protein dynactin DCTN1/Glued [Phaffia rhodozyma]|uniref:Microtubule-associated protein dynactin DCTN1/Glued n=1 Tax=Phaffia rhodozyma TaxID=264483 RepID=A0A0F7SSD7_PHARH|nr:Microtubule-associated protein dynactin DCTN1/Glued [Phaffia rhodozyma]